MKKAVLYLVFLVYLLNTVSAASVGAAPGSIKLGEVEKGSTIEREIYVVTNFRRSFTVDPYFTPVRRSDKFDDEALKYEVSEEDFSDWISFDTSVVNGSTSITETLADGSPVTANGKFKLKIDIPSDAEPGYHYGSVSLNPILSSSQQGSPGSLNWGEAKIPLRFRVKGNVRRQFTVQDVRAFRLGESRAKVDVLVRNSGTVTASLKGFPVTIYDRRQNKRGKIFLNDVKIPPGSSEWVSSSWNQDEKIEEGVYEIDGTADYITGSATASGSFSLPSLDIVEVRPEDDESELSSEQNSIPLWFVMIVLSILGVLMWGFDIEPFWIVTVIGIIGISTFIVLSGVPNFLLAILLIVVGIVLYGGM